jgi:hypothetical protein
MSFLKIDDFTSTGLGQTRDKLRRQAFHSEPGEVIEKIEFAAFGRIDGDCSAGFTATREPFGPHAGEPICSSPVTQSVVERLCIGKAECRLNASIAAVAGGVDPCAGQLKQLVVNASGCRAVDPYPPSPPPSHPPWQTRWVYDFGQNVAVRKTAHLFLSFPHVCPEPVLAK